MIFRQLCSEKGGHLAYVLADPVTREAIAVDVGHTQLLDMEAFLHSRGLRLHLALHTHWEEGQAEVALHLRDTFGARVVAHERADDGCIDMRIRHEDVLYFGEESVRVLHTPGLSPCAVMYHWNDRLFTGPTLSALGIPAKVRSSARRQLQVLLAQLLDRFPEETLLYPARESQRRRLGSIEELRRLQSPDSGGDSAGWLHRCTQLLQNKETASKVQETRAEKDLHRYVPGQDVPASL